MTKMRAKLVVTSVIPMGTTHETVEFRAVCKEDGPYPDDGSDENNTFAKFSPQADFKIVIANPALLGGFARGDKFYVDFKPADQPAEDHV